MNQLRCAYAGAVLSSGLTPAAGEEALPHVSPSEVIPSSRPRRFPNFSAKRRKPPSYEDANCYRIALLPAHFGDWKRGDHANSICRHQLVWCSFIRGSARSESGATPLGYFRSHSGSFTVRPASTTKALEQDHLSVQGLHSVCVLRYDARLGAGFVAVHDFDSAAAE
jgi:hypothetical protein